MWLAERVDQVEESSEFGSKKWWFVKATESQEVNCFHFFWTNRQELSISAAHELVNELFSTLFVEQSPIIILRLKSWT